MSPRVRRIALIVGATLLTGNHEYGTDGAQGYSCR
jgi:hypothetical protein